MNTEEKDLIQGLKDALAYLSNYSVYHDDVFNEEIIQIENAIKEMEEKIEPWGIDIDKELHYAD